MKGDQFQDNSAYRLLFTHYLLRSFTQYPTITYGGSTPGGAFSQGYPFFANP